MNINSNLILMRGINISEASTLNKYYLHKKKKCKKKKCPKWKGGKCNCL